MRMLLRFVIPKVEGKVDARLPLPKTLLADVYAVDSADVSKPILCTPRPITTILALTLEHLFHSCMETSMDITVLEQGANVRDDLAFFIRNIADAEVFVICHIVSRDDGIFGDFPARWARFVAKERAA